MISTLCSVAFVIKAVAIHSQLWRETQLFERGQKHRIIEVDKDHLEEAVQYTNLRIQGPLAITKACLEAVGVEV